MTKHSLIRRVLLVASVASLVTPVVLRAQSSDEPAVPPPLSELKTEVRIMTDDGKLIAVPTLTLQEVLDHAAREEGQPAPQPPRGQFADTVHVVGSIGSKRAVDLQVTLKLKIAKVDDETEMVWAAFPLRLDNSFVSPDIDHEGEGDFYLQKNEDAFIGWLRGVPDSEHTITLQVKAPLQVNGIEKQLAFVAPNWPTRFEVAIPESSVAIQSAGDNDILETATSDVGTDVTLFTNDGGPVVLSWRAKEQVPKLTEASARIVYDIDGNRLQAEAELSVRRRGEPLASFSVQLPLGMEFLSSDSTGFNIAVRQTSPGEPEVVVVTRSDGPTTGLMSVRLLCSMTLAAVDGKTVLDAAGFRVMAARRQWGSVDFLIDGNQSVKWQPGRTVTRDPRISDAMREAKEQRNETVARFQFESQPFRLGVELQRTRDRARVSPSYTVQVTEELARLSAAFDYNLPLGGRESVEILLPGWTVERVLPDSLLAGDYEITDGKLVVPLAEDASAFELQVIATQPLVGSDLVRFELPRPKEGDVAPATVVIAPAANVALTPDSQAMELLVVDSDEESAVDDPQLRFREDSAGQESRHAVFVADRQVLPLAIDALAESNATITPGEVELEQVLQLTIRHESVRELDFLIPVSGTTTFTRQSDDAVLDKAIVETDDTPGTHTVTRVDLGDELIGDITIIARTTYPFTQSSGADAFELTLVQPVVDDTLTLSENRLHLSTGDQQVATITDEQWKLDTTLPEASRDGVLHASSDGTALAVALRVASVERRRSTATVVSRAWVQTWLEPTRRRDRACYRLTTTDSTVGIRLPRGVDEPDWVAVDGREPDWHNDDGLLTVQLNGVEAGNEYTLELWWLPATSPDRTVQATLPVIEQADRVDRIYWQVVMPKSRHLLWTPFGVTPELEWYLQDLYWGRRGRLESRELEQLLHASRQDADKLPDHTNRYLFTSTGNVTEIEVATGHRLVTMFVLSGSILAVALALLHVPLLRHPTAYLVAAVAVAAVSVTFPATAVLAAQAGAIGIIVSLMYPVVRALFGAESSYPPATIPDSTFVPVDSQSVPTNIRRSEGSSRAATSTGATQPYPAPPTA